MTTPNIDVDIQPNNGEAVVYEPAAAKSQGDQPLGVICLMLDIINKGTVPLHLKAVSIAFDGVAFPPLQLIPVPDNWVPPAGHGVDIPPGKSAIWNFLRQPVNNMPDNDTILTSIPAPSTITVSLQFNGFDTPWRVTKPLVPHVNSVAGGAYLYPALIKDLRPGEFWHVGSNSHETGANGSQLFAYDMGVAVADTTKRNNIDELLPGADGGKNEHYRIWGKPVHAMADGYVLNWQNDVGTNPTPGKSDGPWQQNTAPFAPAGNHFYIQHGDEVVLYAHMQEGSLNPDLIKPTPAGKANKVLAGQYLGLAGNSGSSSAPHLHIHAIKGTVPEVGPLRPLLFRDLFTVDPSKLTASPSGPWVLVDRRGPPVMPGNNAMIWPSPTLPL